MKVVKMMILFFLIAVSLSANSGWNDPGSWEDKANNIDYLLAEGKKVGILLIDMQEGFLKKENVMHDSVNSIVEQQYSFLERFVDQPAVTMIDVRYKAMGQTDEM